MKDLNKYILYRKTDSEIQNVNLLSKVKAICNNRNEIQVWNSRRCKTAKWSVATRGQK